MHDDMRELLGTYVLGQLDEPLSTELEGHLATCEACTAELDRLRPLVLPLGSLDPATLRPTAEAPSAELDRRIAAMLPPEHAPSEHAAVVPLGARRSRRWAVAVAGAAVGAAAATGIVLTVQHDPAAPVGPTVVAVPDVSTTDGVTATAGLVDHSWGVEVKLQMDGLRQGERYDFRVVDESGEVRDAGEVLGVSDKTVTCSMSSSILLADASTFDVVDESGRTVVSGSISA